MVKIYRHGQLQATGFASEDSQIEINLDSGGPQWQLSICDKPLGACVTLDGDSISAIRDVMKAIAEFLEANCVNSGLSGGNN